MSAWSQLDISIEPESLSDIIKAEKTEKSKVKKQIQEDFNLAKQLSAMGVYDPPPKTSEALKKKPEVKAVEKIEAPCSSKSADYIESILLQDETVSSTCEEDDRRIAELLQAEFDLEYDEEIKRLEINRNKNSKVSVSLAKYRLFPDDLLNDNSDKEDEDLKEEKRRKNWDRFEENDKEISRIGKAGYVEKEDGKFVTKHDMDLSGRRNAGKVMEFHSDLECGDCGKFDMKISNKVFNELRIHSNNMAKKTHQMSLDRQENIKTSAMGMDQKTRLLLYKFINTTMVLNNIDGIVSTGKEAVVLHGEGNVENTLYPKVTNEVAVKIFSTTLNEFKQRDRYIAEDFRFKGNLKQNNRNIINLWCEKEFHNLNRLAKASILCPIPIVFKKHILIMSYIGHGHGHPAPKLKDVKLSKADLICAYDEIVEVMKKMYQEARLVHADFSEYNILYHDGKCYVIDLAQAVEPIHPSALEFLMRDCGNITNFFEKNDVPVKTKEELFFEITKLDPLTTNTSMLEKIHMKGDAPHVVTNPHHLDETEKEKLPEKYRLKEFPFDYAWRKVEEMKQKGSVISENDNEEESKSDEEWVEVSKKKRTKSKSQSSDIYDDKSADVFKEISVAIK